MNRPILRVYGLVVVLFALLIVFTTRWTVLEAKQLRDNPKNRRTLLEAQRIPRGRIRADDGSLLAGVTHQPDGSYVRRYTPEAQLFAHAIGYSFLRVGQAGLEKSRNDELTGARSGVTTLLDQLQGKRQTGDDVDTTLDPKAQRAAVAALGGRAGSVVALDPRTGAVKVMVSSPGYDPNALASPATYSRLANDAAHKPLVNRATQFGYAPGSTFKVVTATAAIDTGRFTPSSQVSGRNDVPISGVPLQNDQNETFGQIDLTTALAKSVNTAWAQVAERLGKSTLRRYMERFGFDHKPALDYPATQMSTSGEYLNGNLLAPTSSRVDVGRMGIGQDKLSVTPLQMAEVAATVANDGTLMRPHLTARVRDRDGRTVEQITPQVQSRVMQPSTARAVNQMMQAVVTSGTGTPAQIPGIKVAGKTGTAETQLGAKINNVWFIAFAPADRPRVAIAVTVAGVPGFGAEFAAPIAKTVMEALLR
jgi:peptidoglycan glycosyltransferase